MARARPVKILETGAYLPGEPIENEELEKLCGPLPADVLDGLQVKRRHWLVDPATGEHTTTNSKMAEAAARNALGRAGLRPDDVDLIVVSTASPEYHLPTSASYVQEYLGLEQCAVIEIRAGCAGAVQALDIARRNVADGTYQTAVVIGTEAISPLLVPMYLGREPHEVRMRDRLSLYNFGDGAGAVVMGAGTEDAVTGVVANYACVNACLGGRRKPGMQVIGGGTDIPYARQSSRKRLMDIRLDAAGVAKFGPLVFVAACQRVCCTGPRRRPGRRRLARRAGRRQHDAIDGVLRRRRQAARRRAHRAGPGQRPQGQDRPAIRRHQLRGVHASSTSSVGQ